MASQSKTEMKVTVELSRQDRLLLKRIADNFDKVVAPIKVVTDGKRRLSEPSQGEFVERIVGRDDVLAKLASANEDARIALTGEEFAELQAGVLSHRGDEVVESVLKRLLGQSKIEGVE